MTVASGVAEWKDNFVEYWEHLEFLLHLYESKI